MNKLMEYVTSSTNKKRALSVHVIITLRHKIFHEYQPDYSF